MPDPIPTGEPSDAEISAFFASASEGLPFNGTYLMRIYRDADHVLAQLKHDDGRLIAECRWPRTPSPWDAP